jgi:two-component system response regulator PilR (NtrC family)
MQKEVDHILVVDDEEMIRDLMAETLDRWGYNSLTACDGQEAIEKAKGRKIDLVLTDLKMPRKDGIELVQELKELNPDTSAILFTGYGSIDNAVDAFKAGVADYLLKPVDMAELHSKIEDALHEQKAIRSKSPIYSINFAVLISIPIWMILAIILFKVI